MKTLALLISFLVLMAAGCTGDLVEADPSGYDDSAPLVVSPPDGATGVSPNGSITLGFAHSPDTSIVGQGLHLIALSDVADSCLLIAGGWHGDMDHAMMDQDIMDHLDEAHSIAVSMTWDAGRKVATITPHQPLDPNTEYMIHFDDRMKDMLDTLMSRMVGMDGMSNMSYHGFDTTPAGMFLHFRTGDR